MIHLVIDVGKEENDNKSENREIIENTLALFKQYKVKTTFFVTESFSKKYGDLIKEISLDGHEIGLGYLYNGMDNKSVSEKIKKIKYSIEDDYGVKLLGFRSSKDVHIPEFLEDIENAGFYYDNTLNSAWMPKKFNHKLSPLKPFFPLASDKFLEIPISGAPFSRLPLNSYMINKLGTWWAVKSCKRLLKMDIHPVLLIDSEELFKSHKKGKTKIFKIIEKIIQSLDSEDFATLKTEIKFKQKTF